MNEGNALIFMITSRRNIVKLVTWDFQIPNDILLKPEIINRYLMF